MTSKKQSNKESSFLEVIGSENIDIKKLRELCFSGIVETCGIRSICWRILLNYLPRKRSEWPAVLERQRKEYSNFIDEVIVQPGVHRITASQSEIAVNDHPLNPNPQSEWNSYFKENTVLLQIDKDVRRLCPDIAFFQNATPYPCQLLLTNNNKVESLRKRVERTVLNSQSFTRKKMGVVNLISTRKKASQEYDVILAEGEEAHWEVVERMLFIYAKLNPGTGYVQGMNEIIGPLYYTFASDPNKDWSEHAEADTFFCFALLMGEIRDNFITFLDKSTTGIDGSMKRTLNLLKCCDPDLHSRLTKLKIKQEYFLFRWITLLLSQEFPLPDVMHIWDSLFSDKLRFDMLIAVCVAMIILLRHQILTEDFSSCVKLLQNFPESIEVRHIISKAEEISHHLYEAS